MTGRAMPSRVAMPAAGFEPARALARPLLRRLRLPFRHAGTGSLLGALKDVLWTPTTLQPAWRLR